MYRYLMLALAMSLFACGIGARGGRSRAVAERPVKVTVARSVEYVERDFAALSTPMMAVNLGFKISGQIISTPIATGEIVERGALLSRIDPRDVELQLISDRSNYEQAKSSYERAERLLAHEAVALQEVERLESSYLTAKSLYENSREMLQETTIEAPFRAVVERVYVDDYQRVQAGEAVVRIVSPTTTKVEFTLPESSLLMMESPETRFTVRFDNIPSVSFSAELMEYARTSSDASGFPVSLEIENRDPDRYVIMSGMSCMVTMITPRRSAGSVSLPLSAIYSPAAGGTYVWIVDGEDRVELRPVVIEKPMGESSVLVTKGVASGERVVSAGVYQLEVGQRVKILSKR